MCQNCGLLLVLGETTQLPWKVLGCAGRVTSVDDFIHRVECVSSVFHFILECQPRCLTDDTWTRHVAEEVATVGLLYSGALLRDTATAAQGAMLIQPTRSDY